MPPYRNGCDKWWRSRVAAKGCSLSRGSATSGIKQTGLRTLNYLCMEPQTTAHRRYYLRLRGNFFEQLFKSYLSTLMLERGEICSLPFTTELSFRSLDVLGNVYAHSGLGCSVCFLHDGVCEVHKSMTRDAVESKIKNWFRHCPRYAFKNNEDEK
ncbi:hypothetical protein OUZ56_010413 [Daphnia magna]|uniref:Uncharacterized protein n=1 Tax=Daphnia magna TaxID=35525 RepID=A0ABR0AIG9_9CRUS|nr:hypothetical protein OUZ56_010413 [Daphnia magna]